jgi:hypothetical protein
VENPQRRSVVAPIIFDFPDFNWTGHLGNLRTRGRKVSNSPVSYWDIERDTHRIMVPIITVGEIRIAHWASPHGNVPFGAIG